MAAKIPVSSAAVLHCEECGRRFSNSGGQEARCPSCRGERVSGVDVLGGATEFALADRSQGFALEDVRFGKLAQWSGLVSMNQYNEALARQRAAGPGRRATLADVMIERGFLTRRQAEAVLRARVEAADSDDDEAFGKLAMAHGFLTQAQFLKAREVQLDLRTQGREVPPLPVVLYEKRYMQEKEIEALVLAQAKSGEGVGGMIRRELGRPEHSWAYRLIGPKGSARRRVRLAGAAAVILIGALAAWRFARGAGEAWVQVQCAECGKRSTAPLKSRWPVACPHCKKVAAVPLAICRKCGREFRVPNPSAEGIRCPGCGSSDYVLITGGVNVEEIKKQARVQAPPSREEGPPQRKGLRTDL